jgi:hypothetical protein
MEAKIKKKSMLTFVELLQKHAQFSYVRSVIIRGRAAVGTNNDVGTHRNLFKHQQLHSILPLNQYNGTAQEVSSCCLQRLL